MTKHAFVFVPGHWLGQGHITFPSSSESLSFYTSWEVGKEEKGEIFCTQKVQIIGVDEETVNTFTIKKESGSTFSILLENSLVGSIQGQGVYDEEILAWEFRNDPEMEGYESYHIQPNEEYAFHGEYLAPDNFRTIIEGKIWKKTAKE